MIKLLLQNPLITSLMPVRFHFLGGIVDSIFGGPPPAPPAPDYVGAAQTTAAGNLAAAQAATAANRVSQYTPYGSLVYTQNGVDSQGNPMWRADTNLNGVGQQLLDTQNLL